MDSKRRFPRIDLADATIPASLGRASIHSREDDQGRLNFRIALVEELDAMLPRYESEIGDEDHIRHIEEIANDLSEEFREAACSGTIGFASERPKRRSISA